MPLHHSQCTDIALIAIIALIAMYCGRRRHHKHVHCCLIPSSGYSAGSSIESSNPFVVFLHMLFRDDKVIQNFKTK